MATGLYFLATQCYYLGIRLAALFSAKARAWVLGRRHWRKELSAWRQAHPGPLLWMHCASLGEFEQGRPVLEAIREEAPELLIALTFFSPSGYEQKRGYDKADFVGYLPADGPANARQWLRLLRPRGAIFVKYEYWHFHLRELRRQAIPALLIAANFRADQAFFRWYGALFRRMLRTFDHIFVQKPDDLSLLSAIGFQRASAAGDPRVDRVMSIADAPADFPLIQRFAQGHLLWIAGSTWPPDEEILLARAEEHWDGEWKLLIAPHDTGERAVRQLIERIPLPYCRYSAQPDEDTLAASRIMVLDTIGMLSRVYRYGAAAYIGGGFGAGIHNTLEPAAYGLPLVFGPRYHKFPEAVLLLELGGAQTLNGAEEFDRIRHEWAVTAQRRTAGGRVAHYIRRSRGATPQIVQWMRVQSWLDVGRETGNQA